MEKIAGLLKDYCGAEALSLEVINGYSKIKLSIIDDELWFGTMKRFIKIPEITVVRQYFHDGGLVKWNWVIWILYNNPDIVLRVGDTMAMVLAGHTLRETTPIVLKKEVIKPAVVQKRGIPIEEGFPIPHVYTDINKPNLKTGRGVYEAKDGFKEQKKLARIYASAGEED